MRTVKKTIIVAIDVNPLHSPDEDLSFIVTPSQWAGSVAAGYTRYRAVIEIDYPVADYTEIAPEKIVVEKETEPDNDSEEGNEDG